MRVNAKLTNLRIAPRKTKLVADLIRGLDVDDAISQLEAEIKRSGLPMKRLLESAVANAENNFGLDRNNLYIFDVVIGAGPSYKRWMPRAHGRASQILKRTSKINLILEERIEGKGRKTKEQMEKERKQRMEAKKKAEKERQAESERKEKEEKTEKKKDEKTKQKTEIEKPAKGGSAPSGKKETKKTWASKIFRRKSM